MKTMKRITMILMALTLFIAVSVPDSADARRSGGFKSSPRSFTTTPKKSTTQDSVKSTDSTKGTTAGTAATAKRGFFSGGSLMKGMMIGGLAGFLFGSMFAGMGIFGNLLGFAVNLLAIYLVVMLIMSFFRRRQQRRRFEERDGRY
jgi:predicted lipid-binding transport protein (Tim44 family)